MIWFVAAGVFLIVAVLLIAYICFRMAFYADRSKPVSEDVLDLPQGEIYVPFRELMENAARQLRTMPCQELWVTSYDGLQLHGRYYEYAPGAPIELMFHGYRGSAERDLSVGVRRCFRLGHSVLLVDQRCSGRSDGKVITFGIREHRDCLCWLELMAVRFGPEARIILTGISMGASTVLMAAGQPLPPTVVGVLADCGYSDIRKIICHVIQKMGLPPKLAYPFVRLGARLYGGFDPDALSPREALKHCTVPVIFFHGQDDDFVPCYMSEENYDACPTRKALVTFPGAGHGLSYAVDPQRYLDAMQAFFGKAL